MKKSVYFFILLLLASKCFDYKPIAELLVSYHGAVGLIALFVWMVLGLFFFPRRGPNQVFVNKYVLPGILILIGIFTSMVPAYLYYGQSFQSSLVAYRTQYLWLIIPILLFISPKEEELIRPLTWFSLFFLFATFIRSFVSPELFYLPEERIEQLSRQLYDPEVIFGDGFQLLLFPLYYYCDKMREKMTIKNILIVLFFISSLYIIQNRSTLFIAVIIVVYSIITGKGYLKIPLLLIIGGIFFYLTQDVWIELIEETSQQLKDPDYNRVKAFVFFVHEANNNWVTAILGNGFLSAHTTTQMQDLMALGIYNSDLGFIGYWNLYGILPILVFITFIFKAVFSRECPFYVKAIGIHILGCALTISYFGSACGILWFSFFYYLYIYFINSHGNESYFSPYY